jgi:hypothetical protein
VTALVNPGAATANVVERYVYDPYGKTMVRYGNDTGTEWNDRGSSAYANEIRYCGYMFDTVNESPATLSLAENQPGSYPASGFCDVSPEEGLTWTDFRIISICLESNTRLV